MSDSSLFASPPPEPPRFEDCHFYHVMEIPGYGVIQGEWDLRQGVEDYLGHVTFDGKRVLEIGPASGFLTFEMEKRGADVVSTEVTDEPGWDFVPYPPPVLEPVYGPRREIMRRLKDSYWFAHHAHRSRAQMHYGDVYNLPEALGHFDVAVMLAVLLHCRDPLKIVEQCAKRTDVVVITDMFYPELEGKPISQLVPTSENKQWDTWWRFSTDFFVQFLKVMGFANTKIATHRQYLRQTPYTFFTLVASNR